MELYRKHRPKKLAELVGNAPAKKTLAKMVEKGTVPHCLMFTGPSGTGKTTAARILKRALGCSNHDFAELNAADFRGIDMVRDIRSRVNLVPLNGKVRIWLLDEAHQLSQPAQHALLKLIEDTPSHAYFFLCTTHPQGLLKTIHTRATEIKLAPLKDEEAGELLKDIAQREKFALADDVADKIISVADGSPRKALVLLNQILAVDEVEEQLRIVSAGVAGAAAIDLARLLIKPRVPWKDVAAVLRGLDDEPESVRRLILGYAASVLLGGGALSEKASQIIMTFEKNFFDSGKPGLIGACFEIVSGK